MTAHTLPMKTGAGRGLFLMFTLQRPGGLILGPGSGDCYVIVRTVALHNADGVEDRVHVDF